MKKREKTNYPVRQLGNTTVPESMTKLAPPPEKPTATMQPPLHCKGNLTDLRRILHLSLAKGNPK
jgi:hypothetical protein